MIYVYVKHTVANFANWREIYDGHRETRRRKGCLNERLFQKFDDENEVTILFTWSDEQSAREFLGSQDLKDTMQKAGVMQKPEIRFLNLIDEVRLSEGPEQHPNFG
ncbi:MAG: hypothetical protein CME64_14030 [Halobacteriovoraceae bacterium]|nr:hypothetical protein [Halobacteriovoraceae bacterium]|tara:strand:- start:17461 stop:17778 length:318 start_codon:yes stop_codon:yes gene_type:complete